MHHQTDYALIKLSCRRCDTRDTGDTSEYMAERAGWVEVEEVDDHAERIRIHRWWSHTGICPSCLKKIIQRRKENQPVKRNAIKFIAGLGVGAALIFAMSVSAAPPVPPPPLPTDLGACCYGSGYVVAFTTRRNCNTAVNSPSGKPGMFVNGAVPTVDENPCDILPRGD